MNYLQEQNEWKRFLAEQVGVEAVLVSVSVCSSDCRIYRLGDSVFKVKRLTPASIRGRLNSLEDEFLILQYLSPISEVPKAKNYKRDGVWELLEMSSIPAIPINDPTFGQPREPLGAYLELVRLVWKLNKLGCSHGDFHFQNAGKNIEGTISIFDLDQAVIANPLNCFLRDFFGIGAYARPSDISLLKRAKNVQFIWPFIKGLRELKQLIGSIIGLIQGSRHHGQSINQKDLQSRASALRDQRLIDLAKAWSIAAASNASSPGIPLAYYSLDISGINFPGERPWLLRWENIAKHVDFHGKKFLELGCNMGLLATHAKLDGAEECLGLDIDGDIVQAATLVSNAFGAKTHFCQHSLDDPKEWEVDFSGYDIVSALSVMHWVKDKNRLWKFLGTHKELLYEGHESDPEAEKNLREAGFAYISSIGLSERGRNVFYAAKVATAG